MNIIQKILFYLADNLLRFLIFTTATVTVLVLIMGSREDVKTAVLDSGAYSKFVPSIIEANKDQPQATSIPLNDPEVAKIINDSFPSFELQNYSENIIDSVYNWLEGTSNKVTFTVDFTTNKSILGDRLSEYAFTNLAFKDTCQVQPEVFDPFTTTCRPYGYDIFEGQKNFAEQIKSSEGFLGETVLNENNLPKNKAGQTLFEQYSYAPTVFQWVKRSPYILGMLTVVMCVIYVATVHNKRKGIHRLGKTIVANSATLIVTPLIFGIILPRFIGGYSKDLSGSSSDVLLNDIVSTIVTRFDRMMILFGAWLLLIGLAVIVGEKMTRPRTRYAGVEKNSGLTSSDEKKQASPRGKLTPKSLPLISSEQSDTKKPKSSARNKKYKKLPI